MWAWRRQMAVSVCYGIWVTLPTIIQPLFTQWIHIVSNSFLKMGSFSSRITSKDMNALLLFPPARSYSSCAWPWKKRNSPNERRYLQTEGRWKSPCEGAVAKAPGVSLTEMLGPWITPTPYQSTPQRLGSPPPHPPPLRPCWKLRENQIGIYKSLWSPVIRRWNRSTSVLKSQPLRSDEEESADGQLPGWSRVIGSAHFASGLSYLLRNHNARTQEFTVRIQVQYWRWA